LGVPARPRAALDVAAAPTVPATNFDMTDWRKTDGSATACHLR
jgi:hypothetical protein